MSGQTIPAEWADSEVQPICFHCNEEIHKCNECDKNIATIKMHICFNEGAEHFCSKKCMEKYKKENYSKEDEIELEGD